MYCLFFGLQEKPFSITPDPRFLFLSTSHQEALGHLLYGIEERKGFIAITGEVGTGKTLLCRALLERLGRHVRTALILNSCLLEIELLRSINADFGIPGDGATRKELIDQLNQYLLEEFSAGRNAVLIIDEAQNLMPPVLEQIRMLSNLETERGKLLQIILVGQPELRQQLARPELRQLNQRIALRYHLQPFNRHETADYINHRLIVAGSHGGVRFSRRALAAVDRFSNGIPRRINLLCDRAMLLAYVRGTTCIDQPHVRQAWSELEGQSGGFLPDARHLRRRGLLLAQGMIFGLALSIVGGAWLGLNWPRLLEIPALVLGDMVETSANTPAASSADAAGSVLEVPATTPSDGGLDASPRAASLESLELPAEATNEAESTPGEASGAFTPTPSTLGGFSPTNFPGEVLLRVLLAELRPELPRGAGVKLTITNVASTFGLETLPVRIDLSRLKQFRVVCLVEVYAAHTSTPTLMILRGITADGVELIDASSEIKQLGDAEFAKVWSGQAYLFHRRGLELRHILSRGKQSLEVRTLQQRLTQLGYMQADASGLFDEDTTEAVRRLQRDHALQVDGAAGPATKIVLYHLVGRSLDEVRQE